MSRESDALDRHITGHYGEDQFAEYDDPTFVPEEEECQVSNCHEPADDGVLCTGHLAEAEAAST